MVIVCKATGIKMMHNGTTLRERPRNRLDEISNAPNRLESKNSRWRPRDERSWRIWRREMSGVYWQQTDSELALYTWPLSTWSISSKLGAHSKSKSTDVEISTNGKFWRLVCRFYCVFCRFSRFAWIWRGEWRCWTANFYCRFHSKFDWFWRGEI